MLHSSAIRELSSEEVKLNFIVGINKEIFFKRQLRFFLNYMSIVYSKLYLILDNSWHSSFYNPCNLTMDSAGFFPKKDFPLVAML